MSAHLSIGRLLIALASGALAAGLAPQSTAIQALERYRAGDYSTAIDQLTVDGGLRKASREIRSGGREWIEAAPPEERTRRLSVVAAVSTELLARGVEGTRTDYAYVQPLVEFTCKLFQKTPQSGLEHLHHLATIALLQAAGDGGLLLGLGWGSTPGRDSHIQHARARFPDDSRLAFALLQSTPELRMIAARPASTVDFVYGKSGSRQDPEGAKRIRDAISRLGTLADDPLVGDEVVLRRGVLQFRFGHTPAALVDLRRATESADPFIQYLGHLMLGVLFDQTGESMAAIGSYSSAVRVVPGTAATIALSNALFLAGRRTEADELLRDWNRSTADPWREYEAGSYRHFPRYLAEMRAIVRVAAPINP